MRIETIFEMSSPYRDHFRISGYHFGKGKKTLAIVGPMRGDEVQQQYICSQIISRLTMMEQRGEIKEDKSILVIPSCNTFSMNVSRRFWAMDNTDVNRMFPGYDKGETTQRIAAAIFSALSGYEYGIQLASFYVHGDFIPHVRMFTTGYEDIGTARLFGMRYVTLSQPKPFDTTLLNYNWQLWNTKAFSVYAGNTDQINLRNSEMTIDAIMNMMARTGIVSHQSVAATYESVVIDESQLQHIKARHAGIYYRLKETGSRVSPGDTLAHVIDPYNGQILNVVKATAEGVIFFSHNRPVVLQNALLFMIHTVTP